MRDVTLPKTWCGWCGFDAGHTTETCEILARFNDEVDALPEPEPVTLATPITVADVLKSYAATGNRASARAKGRRAS